MRVKGKAPNDLRKIAKITFCTKSSTINYRNPSFRLKNFPISLDEKLFQALNRAVGRRAKESGAKKNRCNRWWWFFPGYFSDISLPLCTVPPHNRIENFCVLRQTRKLCRYFIHRAYSIFSINYSLMEVTMSQCKPIENRECTITFFYDSFLSSNSSGCFTDSCFLLVSSN